jgi:hypothetical protein
MFTMPGSLHAASHTIGQTCETVQAVFVEPATKAVERLPADVRHLLDSLLAPNPGNRLDSIEVRHSAFSVTAG